MRTTPTRELAALAAVAALAIGCGEDAAPAAPAADNGEPRTYSIRYAESQAATALVEITPDGEFVPALEGPGLIVGSGVLRVR